MTDAPVLFVINVISHYQIPLFNQINEELKGKLKVVSVRDIPKQRKKLGWDFQLSAIQFEYKILKELSLKIREREILFSPGIISELLLKKRAPKVVLVGGYYTITSWMTLLLAKLRRAKVVLRSGTQKYSAISKSSGNRFLKRCFIKHVDTFVAYGTLARDYLTEHGADPKKIWIEYDTVDVEALQKRYSKEMGNYQQIRRRYQKKLGLNESVILFVGQFVKRKNVMTLIKMAARLKKTFPKAQLVLVGSGEQSPLLEKTVIERDLTNVIIAGPQPYEKVMEYYMGANVFVISSYLDPYPLVVNEAMSFACPIILSKNCGNSPDMIDSNGYIIEDPNDWQTFTEKATSILSDPYMAEAMGLRSFEIVASYDIANAATAICGALKYSHVAE